MASVVVTSETAPEVLLVNEPWLLSLQSEVPRYESILHVIGHTIPLVLDNAVVSSYTKQNYERGFSVFASPKNVSGLGCNNCSASRTDPVAGMTAEGLKLVQDDLPQHRHEVISPT